jgi:hypothetical protein
MSEALTVRLSNRERVAPGSECSSALWPNMRR